MSFKINQTGDVRRTAFELSVRDFRTRAAEGPGFWRGIVVGLSAGIVISYAAYLVLVTHILR